MAEVDSLYSFVFRGLLAEDALDSAGRKNSRTLEIELEEIANLVGLHEIDEDAVKNATQMSVVYTAIASFENSARSFVSSTMLEEVGEGWWQSNTSKKIKEAAESRQRQEEKIKWHASRGTDPLQFTMLPNLLNIIRQNFEIFEPYLLEVDWVASIFDVIERSRNIIMHSGTLTKRDIARLGSSIKDWNSQVAT